MKPKLITASLLLGCFMACKTARTYPNLQKAEWLIGNWENRSAQGSLTETWKKASDSVYNGQTTFMAGKDTLFTEAIQLVETAGKFAYVTAVSNQNGGQPVRFEMTSITDEGMVFENPKHDFPQKIIYNRINNDSLVVFISGKRKGKQASESFPMKRIK